MTSNKISGPSPSEPGKDIREQIPQHRRVEKVKKVSKISEELARFKNELLTGFRAGEPPLSDAARIERDYRRYNDLLKQRHEEANALVGSRASELEKLELPILESAQKNMKDHIEDQARTIQKQNFQIRILAFATISLLGLSVFSFRSRS